MGSGAKVGRRLYKLTLATGSFPRIAADYAVDAGGETYDAFQLAQDCMDEWAAYLKAKGLLT